MGININWSNKETKDIEIARIKGDVEKRALDNKASVDKHTNTTNLIGQIANGVLKLVTEILGNSKRDE